TTPPISKCGQSDPLPTGASPRPSGARSSGATCAASTASDHSKSAGNRGPPRATVAPMPPLLIGIAGGTGSGKTTVARALADGLPPDSVALVDHDSYYRDRSDLSYDDRCRLNFDHPDSLENDLLVVHLERLRAGERVEVPIYDFKTHA